jgi:hypothetical protein
MVFGKGPLIAVALVILGGLFGAECAAQATRPAENRPQVARPAQRTQVTRVAQAALALPDLTVSVDGPNRAIAGRDIAVAVTVKNAGRAVAPGSASGAAKRYFVDLVLSANATVPVALAVQPVYAGKTRDDFVEDMLMEGGRISNTQNVPPGGQVKYSLSLYVPKRTPPGLYCLGAVVDPGKEVAESNENNNTACLGVMIAPPPSGPVRPIAGVWVMPYAVGGTPLNLIKPTGLTDYTDGSGLAMNNAPFGGYLGFRHGYHNSLPSPAIKYYRWLYRREGEAAWREFTEPVGVHYSRQQGGKVSFPVYPLGPKSIAGKNLYEFRPHTPPSEPGAVTSWPTTDYFGDIYSGFLNSPLLQEGSYDIRLEVFSPTGVQVMPGAAFNFVLPASVAPDGTITTKPAGTQVVGGGCEFALRLDNRGCSADIDPPRIGASAVVDACGFLLYQNAGADKVRIGFHGAHPAGFGVFSFRIVRGIQTANAASGEVSAMTAGVYTGDGDGDFSHVFSITELLGPQCSSKAAFSENLHVYAKATTGWGHRISSYDADYVRAFALAPGAP